MSLTLALNNAISGLRINQQSLGVLSQNIANVNTEGYSRQIINQSAINLEGIGNGVKIDEITRKIDKYLQRSLQTQSSTNASSHVTDDYYQRLQSLLGQPGAGNSIDEHLTTFFNTLQQLADTPQTTSYRSNAISSAVNLATQLSGLARNVEDLRFEADRDMGEAVTVVNRQLAKLADLNLAITRASGLKQSTAGLLDERDTALRTLSENLDVAVTYEESGSVSVVASDGTALVEGSIHHELFYEMAPSVNSFIDGNSLNPLSVLTFDSGGRQVGSAIHLISSGNSASVSTNIISGKLNALQQLRDSVLPEVLNQLDMLASRLRDSVNTIHNNGSGFPPATSLTGDRVVSAADQFNWTGSVRIAVLQSNGQPVGANYADESYTGIRPLTMDLGLLNSGDGDGLPTIQTIIDEINNHFGPPGYKAVVGNINNIQLVSDVDALPTGPTSLFNFDLDLENLSAADADFFVTNITVLDDTASNITSITQAVPAFTLATTGSYTTTNGSPDVVLDLQSVSGVAVGDMIYLNAPSGAVNGIPAANLTGYFTVQNINGTQITVTATASATSTGSVNDAGNIQIVPPYDTVAAGEKTRTRGQGEMQVDLTAGITSTYYDITVDVGVLGADGVVKTSQVTYRVPNSASDIRNQRYDVSAIAGSSGTRVTPGTTQSSMRAMLVDADGNELPKVNGKYSGGEGYLKLVGGNGESYSVVVDELDSEQLGQLDVIPSVDGTHWGFSHYFGLNNFFSSNGPTTDGDTLKNSAINLQVESRIRANPNLISTGALVLQRQSADPADLPQYTYVRYAGDNSAAQQLAGLSTATVSFDAAGGLPTTQLSLGAYTSEMLGYLAQRSSAASDNAKNTQMLYDGFKSKAEAIGAVNLDEELANTIIYQNAYSATARIVSVVNDMYDALLQMV